MYVFVQQSATLVQARVTASQQLQQQRGKHMQEIDAKAAVRIISDTLEQENMLVLIWCEGVTSIDEVQPVRC